MRISYRQGLIAAPANFIQIGQSDSRYVDLIVSPNPVMATVAVGSKDYLITEQRSVTNAWGPFTGSETHYLYWDINLTTGAVTRSSTNTAPVVSASEPTVLATGLMWWDTNVNIMKIHNGSRWVTVLRVFAGRIQSGGILIPEIASSQVGLNMPVDAGTIVGDGLGGIFKNAQGEFLTTDTALGSTDTGSLVKLDGAQIIVQANENIPKFSLVYIVGGRAALASGIPPFNEVKAPIAVVTADAYQNDSVNLVTTGKIIVNEQWSWPSSSWGSSVYCNASGGFTLQRPGAYKNIRVGTIISAQRVLLSFDWETEVPQLSQAVTGINAVAPITKSGNAQYPSMGILLASSTQDGYISSLDFARIPALEFALLSKSDVGHLHAIADVTGLQLALDGKANTIHLHVIDDVTGLQLALDGKANTVHTHVKADITDLQPVFNAINLAISLKATKVPTAIAGNFASFNSGGDLLDSTYSNLSFALVVHGHTIADVTGLQLALDGKANTIHAHAIADVTGLQLALNDKSNVGHLHIIDDVTGLQLALDGKADTIHLHAIADVTGLQLALDGKADTIHLHAIADVTGLQLALDDKSNVGHGHVIADVTGLQIALNAKANINHTHALASLSDVNLTIPPVTENVLKFDGTNWTAGSALNPLSISNITGVTDYVITPLDIVNKMIRVVAPFGNTTYVSIPTDANLSCPIGTSIIVASNGAGIVELRGQAGAVVHSPQSLRIDRQYGRVILIKVAPNTWEVDGQLVAQVQLHINPVNPVYYSTTLSTGMVDLDPAHIIEIGFFSYDGQNMTIVMNWGSTGTSEYSTLGLVSGGTTFANTSIHGKYIRCTMLSGSAVAAPTSPVALGEWIVFTGAYNPYWIFADTVGALQPYLSPYIVLQFDVSDTPDIGGLLGTFNSSLVSPAYKHVIPNFITNHNPTTPTIIADATGKITDNNNVVIGEVFTHPEAVLVPYGTFFYRVTAPSYPVGGTYTGTLALGTEYTAANFNGTISFDGDGPGVVEIALLSDFTGSIQVITSDTVTLLGSGTPPPPPPPPATAINVTSNATITVDLNVGDAITGGIAWYSVILTATSDLLFDTVGSAGDTYLGLYNELGELIAQDDDSGGNLAALINLTGMAPGTYYIAVGMVGMVLNATAFDAIGVGATTNVTLLTVSTPTLP